MNSKSNFFTPIAQSGVLLLGFWVSILLLIVQWVITGVFFSQLPPEVPLLYSLPYGKARLIEKQWFLLLPALGIVFWLVNILMMRIFKEAHVLIRQMTVWTTCLILGLLIIAQAYLVLLVL